MFDPLESILPLKTRIIVVTSLFTTLGIYDYIKNPQNPKRAKEYLFLLSTILISILYAIINDIFTITISREYFIFWKGIPDDAKFIWRVFKYAVQGSYGVGLILGILVLGK